MPTPKAPRQRGEARYQAIEAFLKEIIERSAPGDLLPTEAELCQEFSVSRMTVRQALQSLANAGLVDRRRGRGTFVASRPMHRRPGQFLSFTEEMARRGLSASSLLLSSELSRPTPQEVDDMDLAAGELVLRIARVRLANKVPIALEHAALATSLVPTLEADLVGGSMHQALLDHGIIATRAVGSISARLARSSETDLLDLPPNTALLVEVRILFDQNGRVFERTETRYAADRYVIDVVHTHP
ncbi:MAG TPA: GntR family transcriptional regulator [Dermatophilaceae bacterium]|nr:GntR family transcriptional regulator [Dermatophilaceae bacterium]